jgi:putative ATP-binding cassette transporter
MRTTRFLRAFWALTKPYWVSRERKVGLILLATVIGLTLFGVWLEVKFNSWNRDFFNSLQDKEQAEFFRQLGMFTLLAVMYIVNFVYRQYFLQMLLIEWRSWITGKFLKEWTEDQTHYRLALLDKGTDNPDQRIAEDLRLFVEDTLTLGLGLLSAVVTLVTFVGILWTLSGSLEIWGLSIPGYMVWVCLVYAVIGTWLAHLIGRPLIGLHFNQQRLEADFRFSLVRLRENGEGVALYGGEREELASFHERFAAVIGNWWSLMKKQKQLGWFQSFYGQLAIIFPYIVSAPGYFAGKAQMGYIFQTVSAFGQVQTALSWFIDVYSRQGTSGSFAAWKATVDRLTGFAESLEKVRAQHPEGERVEEPARALSLSQLHLELPQGRTLLEAATFEIKPGEHVLVSGATGSGKSTLFRALAGIWPYWKGRINLPKGAKLLFLPQKPYLPIGSLKHAVSYPEDASRYSDEELRAALAAVGLEHLTVNLGRSENWAQVLSGGEQQRLAFARALLNRPDWLFLDEATAALPDEAQDALYRLIKEKLPKTTLVSIGHRSALASQHQRQLQWRDGTLTAV